MFYFPLQVSNLITGSSSCGPVIKNIKNMYFDPYYKHLNKNSRLKPSGVMSSYTQTNYTLYAHIYYYIYTPFIKSKKSIAVIGREGL
jgi:hypothetical protein